jgi:imidazolonepropionase-like amidohydrolase
MPEPGRSDVPYWVTTEAEARKAVQELAAQKVDIVKIWVDDRNGKYKKLTPELYTAVIDEAHKHGLRVTVHVYYLEDAKGLLEAGVDAFAHGVRDKDVDEEFMALVKARPDFVLVPNLPDRGVVTDVSWLADHVSAGELEKLQAGAAKERPAAQEAFGIQARSLAKMNAAGVTIALGTDGGIAWSHHLEMEDMVAAGMTPHQVIVAATGNAAGVPAAEGSRDDRGRQERRLPRARRQSARRHHQHAEDRRRLPARRPPRPRRRTHALSFATARSIAIFITLVL